MRVEFLVTRYLSGSWQIVTGVKAARLVVAGQGHVTLRREAHGAVEAEGDQLVSRIVRRGFTSLPFLLISKGRKPNF